MLKSVARLGATRLSICAELRALRREAYAFESFAKLKLCARLGAQRHPAEPSTGTSAPKAGKIAEGGKDRRRRKKAPKAEKSAECRNKEMAISRRLEGLRSSRLDHSMQNFMPELLEALPRPDSPKLEGKITKNWGATAEGGKNRRRREKSPKAGKIAEGGKHRRRRERSPKARNGRKWVSSKCYHISLKIICFN